MRLSYQIVLKKKKLRKKRDKTTVQMGDRAGHTATPHLFKGVATA